MQGWRGGPGRAAPARHPPLPRTVLRKEGSDIGGGCGEQDGRSRHSGGAEAREVDGGESAGEEEGEARGRVELRRARADRSDLGADRSVGVSAPMTATPLLADRGLLAPS